MLHQSQKPLKRSAANSKVLLTNLRATIAGYENDISVIEAEIKVIKERINTRSFRWMESIALGPDPIIPNNLLTKDDYARLKSVDIKKLSSQDLQKMITYLRKSKDEIERDIHKLRMEIQQIETQIKADKNAQESEILKQRNQALLLQYQTNPSAFLAGVFANFQADPNISKQDLYQDADQILAICNDFDSNTEPRNLWLAWEVVTKAAQLENRLPYVNGAIKLLNVLCKNLPPGMHGLKFLYQSKQFDKVNSYLRRIYLANVKESPEEYNELLSQLIRDVQDVSLSDARVFLEKAKEFTSLTNDTQRKSIIAQQAFINLIEFDVNYLEHSHKKAEILSLLKLLKSNIHNFLNPKIKFNFKQNQVTFESLKNKIMDSTGNLVLQNDSSSHIPESLKFGSGLGLMWSLPTPVMKP